VWCSGDFRPATRDFDGSFIHREQNVNPKVEMREGQGYKGVRTADGPVVSNGQLDRSETTGLEGQQMRVALELLETTLTSRGSTSIPTTSRSWPRRFSSAA